LGGTVELKEWLNFLYEKDPEGKKRMTLSNLMENYVLLNNLVASMGDVCSSTDSRIQQCLAPARLSTKPGSINCMTPYDTGMFNFGRCLHTGTYCELENGLSEEQLCSISRGDYYLYVPTTCVIKNIEDYEPPVCEATTCGNGICDKGEETTCPEDCTTSFYCGDGLCRTKDGESFENCPADCSDSSSCAAGQILCAIDQTCDGTAGTKLPEGQCCTGTCTGGKSGSCGDGVCDSGEKDTCPSDCVINK
jgi:hypothetical protein